MKLTCREIQSVQVLAVSGRLDHARTPEFETALMPYLEQCSAAGAPRVLDFSWVEYVSSIGLRALMLAARKVKAQNGRIAIAALPPVVAEVFRIGRFDLVFSLYDRVDAAVAALAK